MSFWGIARSTRRTSPGRAGLRASASSGEQPRIGELLVQLHREREARRASGGQVRGCSSRNSAVALALRARALLSARAPSARSVFVRTIRDHVSSPTPLCRIVDSPSPRSAGRFHDGGAGAVPVRRSVFSLDSPLRCSLPSSQRVPSKPGDGDARNSRSPRTPIRSEQCSCHCVAPEGCADRLASVLMPLSPPSSWPSCATPVPMAVGLAEARPGACRSRRRKLGETQRLPRTRGERRS